MPVLMKRTAWQSSIPALVLWIVHAPAAVAEVVVVHAKRIYTAQSEQLQNASIVIDAGKIVALGSDVHWPEGAREISAEVVIPGLIDLHSHLGLKEGANETRLGTITPQVHALDSINFEDPAFHTALAAGLTTLIVRPGSGNLIGGVSAAVKLSHAPLNSRVLKEPVDLKMGFWVPGQGSQMATMMGAYAAAREAFLDAQRYQKSWDVYDSELRAGKHPPAPARDLGKDNLVKALKREIPVYMHCGHPGYTAGVCIRLADEFNLRLTLGHVWDGYRLVRELSSRHDIRFDVMHAGITADINDPKRFKNYAAILSNAGLNVSLHVDAPVAEQQHLRHFATLAVRQGMNESLALKAITLRPAQAAGIDQRVGSIAIGKDADLVLLDGDPFELTTSVDAVLIDGMTEYRRPLSVRAGRHRSATLLSSQIAIPSSLIPAQEAPTSSSAARRFAIRGGTVATISGAPIEAGVILINEGKIERVGAGIEIPPGVPVIDASGAFVMPGVVLARSYVGTATLKSGMLPPEGATLNPQLSIRNSIDPDSEMFSWARRSGVTSALVTPGFYNLIGGRGVVIKMQGASLDTRIVKENAALAMSISGYAPVGSGAPSSRMGSVALLRQTLIRTQEYQRKIKQFPLQDRDSFLEALIPVLEGRIPLIVACQREDDIRSALRIATQFRLKLILDGASSGHRMAGEIAAGKAAVVIDDIFKANNRGPELDGYSAENAARLSAAGVPVALALTDGNLGGPHLGFVGADPFEVAAFAYKNGLPEALALRAITLDAARIIGVEDRVGSLEPGKDADIVILSGHPFETHSLPECVFIDGRLVYRRKADDLLTVDW